MAEEILEYQKNTEVKIDNNIIASTNNSNIEVQSAEPDVQVLVNAKNYTIVGDELYIPKRYEDAPQWLRDIIGTVTEESFNQKITELNGLTQTLNQLIVELDVAKNTYTQSIISSNDINERINTAITTLNSSLAQSDATILGIANTKVTPQESMALTIDTLSASIENGAINALVSNIENASVDRDSALANDISLVHSELTGDIEGNATAISTLNTYVGVTNGTANGTGLLADVEILQKQNDGIIETVTGTYDVMLNPQDPNLAELVVSAEPYASWKARDLTGIDTRLAHIGDVYIKYNTTSNGAREYVASYKFIRTIVDSTSPYATDSDGFTWALIVNQAAQDAYQQALNAYDLADNKRRVFTTTPTGSIDEGDLWVTGTNPQVVKVYKSGNWELSDTQVGNFISVTYTPTITSLQNQIDGKIESWYTVSINDPKTAWTDAQTRAKHDGDIWYQTDTKLSYYYSSSTNSWNSIDDAKAIQALADAATAQATADGKISSYYMSTLAAANVMSNTWTDTEKVNNVGDLVVVWNDTTLDNNGTWRWDGTNWVTTRDKKLIALASDVTNLSTELDNGANTWASADSTLENSLRTEIGDEGARVESKFAYNSNVNINGVWKKSGFGLTANYVSGSGIKDDPYVSEFWIDASRLKFTNSNQTGQVSPFTIDATGVTPQVTFNGKVSFSNVSDTIGNSANLLYNSAPKIGSETNGWNTWSDSGMTVHLSAGWDIWKPTGGASAAVYISGNPTINSVFTAHQSLKIPVIAGERYEASAYISAHRTNSHVFLDFYDASDKHIGGYRGNDINYAGSSALTNWGRSVLFVTAPANSATARFYIRSIVTGAEPYCFFSYAYAGKATANQTIPSNWSEGSSAGVSSGDVVNDINAGNTTTIDGGKITTGSITANQINTTGLIAENISADELVSKTFTGGVINGARINGAVIKASYLDLDGELEVLTNYHITVAMYNANPSLYTDAVYISADNEYRIPSMSNLRSFLKEVGNPSSGSYLGGTYILNSELYSYASANIGTNVKAVKARPIITIASSSGSAIPENHLYNAVFATSNSGSGYFRFYIGNLLILSVVKSGTSVSYSGLAGSGSIASPAYENVNIVNLSYGGMAFSVRRMNLYGDRIFVTYGGATNLQIMNDWSSGQIRVEAYSQSGSGLNSLAGLRLPAITINNMI